MSSEVRRKLTTILAADADGYSSAMESDEVATLRALQAARSVFTKLIERHHGRIANTAGDGLIADFPSVVEAVQCAIEIQRELGTNAENDLRFRIGIHLGDVLIDGEDLLGEGVNLAARLQTMAEPGGILISRQVYDQVQKKLSVGFEYLGERRPKNFAEAIAVYGVAPAGEAATSAKARSERPARAEAPAARAPKDLGHKIRRRAGLFGVVAAMLLGIDLVTGGDFWAHWPILGMLGLLGLSAAPLLAGRFKVAYVRIAVIVLALVVINLFTWDGVFWAVYPAAGLIALAFIGRLMAS